MTKADAKQTMERHPFSELIAPEALAQFCQRDFEKHPAKTIATNGANSAFTLERFFEILRDTVWAEKTLYMVPNTENRTSDALRAKMLSADGQFTLDKIRASRAAKTTVVVNGIDRMDAPLRSLIAGMNESGLYSTKANAYFTPAGAQGFLPHWDRHDVFVLQIAGNKEWHISTQPDFEFPLEREGYQTPEGFALGNAKSITVESGELLYVPRGYGHYAVALDNDSLHLTIGVHTVTWADVLTQTLNDLIQKEPTFRKSVAGSIGQNMNDGNTQPVLAALQEIDANILIDTATQLQKEKAKKALHSFGQVFGRDLQSLLPPKSG